MTDIMCSCGARGRNPHPWEPGEWCPPTLARPGASAPSRARGCGNGRHDADCLAGGPCDEPQTRPEKMVRLDR